MNINKSCLSKSENHRRKNIKRTSRFLQDIILMAANPMSPSRQYATRRVRTKKIRTPTLVGMRIIIAKRG
ncbi:hypothetical protein LHK_02956 [Laribacter hongkongensis HLHK9]|uniref:Uncharacterized protein n=1 Tax=Laribacter hongkongensis (strain HLHK9) TaxID=557598 RepID=C1D4Z3_LARHH|nr:hypothetical protein LHK_02956 [Laribacter hongkongensis HLHK9]